MSENMGEVIRRLRKERDLTQEELAEQIGVTSQAVSKWENNTGLPDISQVIPLANFFGVSTDTLFDYCSEEKKKEIEEYKERALRLNNKGLMPELIELWREALGKYPGDYLCMSNLAHALINHVYHDDTGPQAEKYSKESVSLCERILSGCTDSELREHAIQLLTYLYSTPTLSFANEEKAVSYAKMGGSLWSSRELLEERAYYTEEGKKIARKICEQNMLTFMDLLCECLLNPPDQDYTEDEQIERCQAALTMWNTLIPDGNFLFFHCRMDNIYTKLSVLYALQGRKKDTLESLKKAAYHAKMYDSQPREERNFTSSFVSHATSDASRSTKNCQESTLEMFRSFLKNRCFNFLRDDPEFIALVE